MIEGLRVTLGGDELVARLGARIDERHRDRDEWKEKGVRARAEAEERLEDGDEPLADDVKTSRERECAYQSAVHDWRAEVLTFLRAHVDPREQYRLDMEDLRVGELLPERPEYDWSAADWKEPACPLCAMLPDDTAPRAAHTAPK